MNVASLAEAWIEISTQSNGSPPSSVASLAEAWIEIMLYGKFEPEGTGRLPRGGVD